MNGCAAVPQVAIQRAFARLWFAAALAQLRNTPTASSAAGLSARREVPAPRAWTGPQLPLRTDSLAGRNLHRGPHRAAERGAAARAAEHDVEHARLVA